MNTKPVWLTAAVTVLSTGMTTCAEDQTAVPQTSASVESENNSGSGLPRFDKQNALILPADYREWIFVGSSLGLSYQETDEPVDGDFSHVYINPFGYQEFRRSGTFPEGTVLMLERFSRGDKGSLPLSGYYSDRFLGLEAAVKTDDRFEDPWTYFAFSVDEQQPQRTAEPIHTRSCINCHTKHAATDHVFTQFYPILNSVRSNR